MLKIPTHRCKVCGAYWKLWEKCPDTLLENTWNLVSPTCGPCCDNAVMGDQIEPLDLKTPLSDNEGGFFGVLGKYSLAAPARNGHLYDPEALMKAVEKRKISIENPLRMEFGFPDELRKGTLYTLRERTDRAGSVREYRVCATVDHIEERHEADDGVTLVAHIKPAGPFKEEFLELLTAGQPAFGLRGFSNVSRNDNGVIIHEILTIVSWDYLGQEPLTFR